MDAESRNIAAATRRIWVPVACAGGATVLAASWVSATDLEQLREDLRIGQFWFLEGIFVALLATSVVAGRHVLRILDAPAKGSVAVLACVATVLVLLAPRTNRIFYDEQIYQSVGQNLSDLGLAQMCNDGTTEYGILQCQRHEYNKQPYGYPHLLSLGYRFFGTSELIAHRMNVVIAGATAATIFLLAFVLTGERLSSGFAAIAFMLLPEQLRWSHSAAAEPSAAFACAVAMLATATFLRFRSTPALLWMTVASSWAVYFRPECILIVAVVGGLVLLFAREEITKPRFLWAVAFWICLLTPAVAHLAAVRNESWGSSNGRFSLTFFWNNLRSNTVFYFADRRFPVAITMLALAGLAPTRITVVLAAWFAIFWGVFLFFYAGSYNYGADVRYSLMSYAPLAVLAGIGTSRLVGIAATHVGRRRTIAVAVALMTLQFAWYLPWVRAVGEEAWAARADVEFAREVSRRLPANALVLTHNPGMFHVWGASAAQLSIAAGEPAYLRDVVRPRYAGGVYVHWNFWCNVPDPIQQAFCDRALAAYPMSVFQERRVRDFRFTFYKVTP